MTGKYVFYPLGVDDNGLPTETLVDKSLESELTLLQLGSEKLNIESES